MPTRALPSIVKSTSSTLAHTCNQQMEFPLDIMAVIFGYYISGEKDIYTALILAHVCRHWRKAAHSLSVLWKDIYLDTSPSHRELSLSIGNSGIKSSFLPNQFSPLDLCIEIPRGISRLLQWTSLKSLSIRNATQGHFKVCIPGGAYVNSLESLYLCGLDGLRLPQLCSLRTLVLSGSKKRIPLQEVSVFLRGLPRLRTLELHGTPISFTTAQSISIISTLLQSEDLPCLTSVRIFGLRSSREPTKRYLGHLLAFLSPISTVSYLQVEAGNEVLELTTVLRPLCPLRNFSNLRSVTFRLIKPCHRDLRGLLNALACSSHAILWLSSYMEYTIQLRPAESLAGLPVPGGRPLLAHVEFLFATEEGLQEFLNVAAARTCGLRNVRASPATLQELCAAGRWSMAPMDPHTCNKKEEHKTQSQHWHAHITCAGDEGNKLCLVPVLEPLHR
ncbi:hypothetical protein FIBSPDRAFT_1047583 [Athelia psychrophila]|uniref:Uncharacterized protein n=1 Tax=Athelia psychrophila TaxID=1759441 RepID=A0A166F224_9AGAM|nr:hypothetical protein FIBSPDRAFT_1047583 [Fibularhizoctonia sp. CBS 109695]